MSTFSAFQRIAVSVVVLAATVLVTANPAVATTPVALRIVTSPQTVAAGACSGLTRVQAQDGASSPAPASSLTTVSLSGSSVKFYSDSSCSRRVYAVNIGAGTASKAFYFKSTVAGTPTITASAPTLAAASQMETITAAAATKVIFRSQPGNVLVGATLAPPVRVVLSDRYGNAVTAATAGITVSIGTNPGSGTLSGSTTLGVIAGVATFGDLRIDTAGLGYTLTARSPNLSSATSNAFTVTTPVPIGLPRRPIPDPLYGVTIDAIDHLPAILTSLSSLSRMATTRVVFDEFVAPSDYVDAVSQISRVSYVMGEILDSAYVKQYTVADYLQRTSDYLDALGPVVDIWEVGNEINGEWLGDTTSVVAKMQGAYDRVKQRGARAALTLYFNQDCWANPANEMFTWTQAHVPDYMKQGLDYVLISYYEDDCNGLQPDWMSVFQKLASMFPNSKIGFGENGTVYASRKAAYIQRYYAMRFPLPQYIGGHFWWYGKQDFVPWTNPLWAIFNDAIRNN